MTESPNTTANKDIQVQSSETRTVVDDHLDQAEPKKVLVNFKTWLSGTLTALSAISSIAAAFSAFSSWQQTEATREVVTLESRNAAFVEVLEAYDAFCAVGINPDDQRHQRERPIFHIESTDGVNRIGLIIEYEPAMDIEKVKDLEKFDIDWKTARANLIKRMEYLSIWESGENFQKYVKHIIGQKENRYQPIVNPPHGIPSVVQAQIFQAECSDERVKMMALYTGIEIGDDISTRYVPIPVSKTKNTFEALIEWGMDDLADMLQRPENLERLQEDYG